MVELHPHQEEAIKKIKNGSILCGGVGTGKSLASLAYYLKHHYGDDLIIITTAKKRDSKEWEGEIAKLGIVNVEFAVDSWNNIGKYEAFKGCFFIFDEQRVVGSGAWVKSFLKITKSNSWVLLSATPGDVWMDYLPVFLAHGFFKNKTEFTRSHVVYNSYAKFPMVDHYVGVRKLERLRDDILVIMKYQRETVRHDEMMRCSYNREAYKDLLKKRWNIYKDEPIQNAATLAYVLRRVVNEDESRRTVMEQILRRHARLIIFYNFTYELEILREVCKDRLVAEWNGQKHEALPDGDEWVYLVQYSAGAEGWNCITTNAIAFYSQTYSYRQLEQAMGRIDRLNTPYTDLYYYHLRSVAPIDLAIKRALDGKKNFNARAWGARFL